MAKNYCQWLSHFAQEFQPVVPFYTGIFIEKKHFVLEEVSNSILPFFFYASLVTTTACFIFIERLSYASSLLQLSISQIFMFIILIYMPSRNFLLAQLIYALGGAIPAYRAVLRPLLVERNTGIKSQTSQLKLYRAILVSSANWIGQEIFNKTGEYGLIISISFVSTLIGIVFALISIKNTSIVQDVPFFDSVSSFSTLLQKLRDTFERELTVRIISGCAINCMQLYLSVYSHALFREKGSKDLSEDPPSRLTTKILEIVRFPIKCISNTIIFCAIRCGYKISLKKESDTRIESGYMEGTAKILANIVNFLIVNKVEKHLNESFYLFLMPFAILSFVMLTSFNSMRRAKILYFITLTLIINTEVLSKSKLYKTPHRAFLFNFCIFTQSIVHTLIGFVCRVFRLRTSTKGFFYIVICTIALVVSVIIKVTG